MTSNEQGMQDALQLRQMALSRWDNEGGAGSRGPQESSIANAPRADVPPLTNTELVQLRVRVIALENLMIALLAQASDRQLDLVREMATYISPRPGFTHHPLTIQAAADMIQLVERASHFRVMAPSCRDRAAHSELDAAEVSGTLLQGEEKSNLRCRD